MKTVELDDDLVEFVLQRCKADIALGSNAVEQSAIRYNKHMAKKYMDYVVMVKRLKAAIEKAS